MSDAKKDLATCIAPDCDKPARSKGMCTSHYQYNRRVSQGLVKAPRREVLGAVFRRSPDGQRLIQDSETRISHETHAALENMAVEKGKSVYLLACELIEAWAKTTKGGTKLDSKTIRRLRRKDPGLAAEESFRLESVKLTPECKKAVGEVSFTYILSEFYVRRVILEMATKT